MRKKYGIVLTLSVCILLTALSFGYRAEYRYLEKKSQEQENEVPSDTNSELLLPVQGAAEQETEETYYLTSLNGYIVVFMADQKTIFEYTDISVSGLPSELQNEIKQGKTIVGKEKLYGFLENYSS